MPLTSAITELDAAGLSELYKKYDERPGTVGAGARAAGLTVCSGVSLETISAHVSAK